MKTIQQIIAEFKIDPSKLKKDVVCIRIFGLSQEQMKNIKQEFEFNGHFPSTGNSIVDGKFISVQIPAPGPKDSSQFLNSGAEIKMAAGNDRFLFHPANLLPPSGNL